MRNLSDETPNVAIRPVMKISFPSMCPTSKFSLSEKILKPAPDFRETDLELCRVDESPQSRLMWVLIPASGYGAQNGRRQRSDESRRICLDNSQYDKTLLNGSSNYYCTDVAVKHCFFREWKRRVGKGEWEEESGKRTGMWQIHSTEIKRWWAETGSDSPTLQVGASSFRCNAYSVFRAVQVLAYTTYLQHRHQGVQLDEALVYLRH